MVAWASPSPTLTILCGRSPRKRRVSPVLARLRLLAGGDLEFARQHVEMFDRALRMRVGFEHARGLGAEIIPLHLLHQVQGPGDGQPAEPVLAFEDRHAGFRLVLEEDLRRPAVRSTSSIVVSSARDSR